MAEQTALVEPKGGASQLALLLNSSRVNSRAPAIGHCADLQQETEWGWGPEARSGTVKKKKSNLGENSCASVEVGLGMMRSRGRGGSATGITMSKRCPEDVLTWPGQSGVRRSCQHELSYNTAGNKKSSGCILLGILQITPWVTQLCRLT